MENSKLVEVLTLIEAPPEMLAIKVTPDNFKEVAKYLRCEELIVKEINGMLREVTFVNLNQGNDVTVTFHTFRPIRSSQEFFICRDANRETTVMDGMSLDGNYIITKSEKIEHAN